MSFRNARSSSAFPLYGYHGASYEIPARPSRITRRTVKTTIRREVETIERGPVREDRFLVYAKPAETVKRCTTEFTTETEETLD